MFSYVTSFYGNRFDHPLLGFMITMAILFAIGGVVVDLTIGNGVAAAFGGVYAILTTALVLGAYAVLYLVKAISMARDRSAPYSSSG